MRMNEQAKTYRKDLYYVNFVYIHHTLAPFMRREVVVSKWKWWFYRLQFWRFAKMVGFNVLYEGERYPPPTKTPK